MSHSTLQGLVAIVLLSVGAQWLAARLKLPSILLLLLAGILAGPVTGIVRPDDLLGDLLLPIVSMAVALILFEGGLSLRLDDLEEIGAPVWRLLLLSGTVTFALGAAAARFVAGLETPLALLLGAILVVSGPTVVLPILRNVRPSGKVGSIARWEGIVIDPIGALLAVILFEILFAGDARGATRIAVGTVLLTIFVGTTTGLAGAWVLVTVLRKHWAPDHLHNAVALALVIGTSFVANSIQEDAALLAVTVMGIYTANQKKVPVRHIIEFKENLSILLISSLFILLAGRLRPDVLAREGIASALFLATLVFVVRPASVFLSTIGTDLTVKEKLFLSWLAPRGIVAAAVASIMSLKLGVAGWTEADRVLSLTFLVIIGTVVVYGLTIGPFARRLGLSNPNSQGVLFIGAPAFAREIAKALKNEGFRILLVDSNRAHVSAARLAGLHALSGNALNEDFVSELDLDGIGKVIALTSNDEVNAIAALHFAEIVGRQGAFQIQPGEESRGEMEGAPSHLRGRLVFGDGTTESRLARHHASGARIKLTRLTDEFDWKAYSSHHGGSAIPLFLISDSGRLDVITAADPPEPRAGQRVLSLALADREPAPAEPETARTTAG